MATCFPVPWSQGLKKGVDRSQLEPAGVEGGVWGLCSSLPRVNAGGEGGQGLPWPLYLLNSLFQVVTLVISSWKFSLTSCVGQAPL